MDFLLIALASFGHGYLLMVLVNVVYSQPVHRTFLKVFRALMGLLIVAGPFAFWYCDPFSMPFTLFGDRWPSLPLAYATLTLAMTVIVFPVVTIRRLLRRAPACIVAETTVTLDVAKELGEPPYGNGESLHWAKLPCNDIFHVDFTTLTLALPDLPAEWDGLTLLQISDLHFFGTPARSFYECIAQRCLADGSPDLLLVTGDLVDEDEYLTWVEPVLGPLRGKIASIAILGNHDWWHDFDAVRGELTRLGIRVVSNRWEQIDVRGQPLNAIGHEGPWFRPGPDLSDCPAEGFRLLLSHTPDNIGWAKRNNVSLMLSGHNHGGQIRVPLIGSIFVPSKYSRRYDMGTFFEPPTFLHVNRGLSGKEAFRFRCRPQVTRFVLKKS